MARHFEWQDNALVRMGFFAPPAAFSPLRREMAVAYFLAHASCENVLMLRLTRVS